MANYSPRLNIVLFNTDTSDKGELITANYICESMDGILDTVIAENYPNLFILAQDKIRKNTKHKKLCEKLHQDHTSVPHKEEAGVYYETNTNTHYDVVYVDDVELRDEDDALEYEAGNVFTVSRLTACVLTPKAGVTTGKKILLVSWHGPRPGNLETRKACFKRLLRFLKRLKDSRSCAMVILGGDFNLQSGEARGMLDAVDGALLDNYTPTADRPVHGRIDYVVYWPRDGLQDAEVSVVMPDFRREHGNRPFDHNIVLYRLEEIETVSDLARQFGSITVYEDEE